MLIGTVVTIYVVLPARHNVLLTEAIEHHRDTDVAWDLEAPTLAELRAWTIGVVGKDAPLPTESAKVIGARRISVLRRDAALMRVQIGDDQVTYLVAKARGMAPKHDEQQRRRRARERVAARQVHVRGGRPAGVVGGVARGAPGVTDRRQWRPFEMRPMVRADLAALHEHLQRRGRRR